MDEVLERLRTLLTDYDTRVEALDESDIARAIRSLRPEDDTAAPLFEWFSEYLAFSFHERENDESKGGEPHFVPMLVIPNNDGTVSEFPSLQSVTAEMLAYWKQRASTAKHSVMRARYADLAWDLAVPVTGSRDDHTLAQTAIDAIVAIADDNLLEYETSTIRKLDRALSLALRLNDVPRIQAVKRAMLELEKRIAQDALPGLWGFAFDALIHNKRVSLSEREKSELIDDLENRLARVSIPGTTGFDPWASEAAALRLAKYYRKNGDTENANRVIRTYGRVFEQLAETATGLVASGWLQNVHRVYLEFGLNDEAKQIAVKLRKSGASVVSEMKEISVPFEISRTDFENYVASMVDGELCTVLNRIAARYVPDKTKIQDQLAQLAKEHPLQYLFRRVLHDSHGRPLATVGSIAEDLEGHVILQVSENMQLASPFMRAVIRSAVDKFSLTANSMGEYLFKSPAFDQSRRDIIVQGLSACLRGDHLVGAHILIPQIENSFRNVLEISGGVVLHHRQKTGGFDLRALGDMLDDPILTDVFGESAILYFRVLLSDPRGWNLRNMICHGAALAEFFTWVVSDRILHVLLCLAQAQEETKGT